MRLLVWYLQKKIRANFRVEVDEVAAEEGVTLTTEDAVGVADAGVEAISSSKNSDSNFNCKTCQKDLLFLFYNSLWYYTLYHIDKCIS